MNIERKFIYTYVRHKDEHELCQLEMRSFFGFHTTTNVLESTVCVDPSRSPFMKERLEVLSEADSVAEIGHFAQTLDLGSSTFKVMCLNTDVFDSTPKLGLAERRRVEKEIGLQLNGEPDLDNPEQLFGVIKLGNRWAFGRYTKSESIWFHHQKKPHSYSTALSTRVARAVANIAAPHPAGVKVIDPCCGIGTVLVEALSMGIDIVGSDMNSLVVQGSRKNIEHFGLVGEVQVNSISEVVGHYDVAIIDMPYNIFTHSSPEEQRDILYHARRIAKKAVIVSIENIDDVLDEVGLKIVDRCEARKGKFVRQILVCE